jgi:hypothetical protein
MRKITKQAALAFLRRENFKLSNTQVIVEGNVVRMYLFDRLIAQKTPLATTISNGGYGKSNTTKERLNGLSNVSIVQKKGVWYLNGNEWDGKNTIIGAFGIWIDGREA